MRHIIIGGGMTGTVAAEELRKLLPDAEITLVSEEHYPVYSRVLLPHYVKGKVSRERCFLKKETWYIDHRIEWLPGMRVTAMDARNKWIALSDGRKLSYDKLLLAIGGEVRPLPEDPRGISYFRTLDDADHLLQLARELPAGARAAIYGGGFIACEYVNIFAHFGIPTTVVFRGNHFFSRTLDAASGALITKKLQSDGKEIIANAALMGFESGSSLTALLTDKKIIPCNLLGIGIGIEPDLAWLRDAGMKVGSGVRTNEYLETSIPDVYAAGDGAEFFDVIVRRRMMVGNWMSAVAQGRIVAKNMAGERMAFKLVSSYATNVLGLELIFIGDTKREAADRIIVRGSESEEGITQLFLRGGRLVGATLVNRNADRAWITHAIQGGKMLHDLDHDLETIDKSEKT